MTTTKKRTATFTFTAHRGLTPAVLACSIRDDVFYARDLLRAYIWAKEDLEGLPQLETLTRIEGPALTVSEMEAEGWEPVLASPSEWWLYCGGSPNPVVGNGELSEFGVCKGCRWWRQWMAMTELAGPGDIPNCHPGKRERW